MTGRVCVMRCKEGRHGDQGVTVRIGGSNSNI